MQFFYFALLNEPSEECFFQLGIIALNYHKLRFTIHLKQGTSVYLPTPELFSYTSR